LAFDPEIRGSCVGGWWKPGVLHDGYSEGHAWNTSVSDLLGRVYHQGAILPVYVFLKARISTEEKETEKERKINLVNRSKSRLSLL
jgi:hypothetical protein